VKDTLADVGVGLEAADVLTIGYEGSTVERFVQRLTEAGVETLVDVRDLPLSRKKGFSKNQLRELVESAGIRYLHLKALGDPKEGRLAARAGEHARFVRIFSTHLKTDLAQSALSDLATLVASTKACLMCFERCHTTCHRKIVVEQLAEIANIKVRHISVEQPGAVRRKVSNCGHN
jgi:uncharacterized protein (DUF488 family)